jgi:hypothetical protein
VTDRPAPLAIHADLRLLAADGELVTVTATDRVIDVTLPRLWSRQWAAGPLADRSRRQALLTQVQGGLQSADLTLRIKVREHVVAQLRPESRPSRLSRLLGLAAVEVRLVPCLRALVGGVAAGRSD